VKILIFFYLFGKKSEKRGENRPDLAFFHKNHPQINTKQPLLAS